MDTRFLDSFLMVVDLGSIAEAARRLHLTPAAVAQRLHALELEVGTALIARSGRGVKPTRAGMVIVEKARQLVREVRDLKFMALDDSPAGELRLGAISTALTGLLPDILSSLAQRHPRVEMFIVPGVSADLYEKLMRDELDLAVIVQPQFAIPKMFGWRVLREEPLIVLVPASMSATDPHKVLATEWFVRYDRKQWGGWLADAYLRRAGIRPRERFELDALDAIAVLVDRGLGVSLVPDWMAPWPAGLSIAKLPLPLEFQPRRIGVLWKRASARASLIQLFLNQIDGDARA